MKTIIIPTDFSSNSLVALEFAIEFFKNSRYVLCNVYDIPRGGTSSLFYLLEELKKQSEKDMKDLMDVVEARYSNVSSSIDSRVIKGDFVGQIEGLVKELNADYVVMGTKGASGIKEVVLGSNAARLVGSSSVPLITVPEDYGRNKVEDLVLCYDGKNISQEVADILHDISTWNQLPIKLFHVRSETESPIQNWKEIEKLIDDNHTSLHEEFGNTFEEGLKKRMAQFHSILVLIRRKKSFWESLFAGSHSKKTVSHIALPILVMPE